MVFLLSTEFYSNGDFTVRSMTGCDSVPDGAKKIQQEVKEVKEENYHLQQTLEQCDCSTIPPRFYQLGYDTGDGLIKYYTWDVVVTT